MPLNRKTLMVAAFAVALCAAGFATPAQAIDNVCSQICWQLSYPSGCNQVCKLPNGSLTTCGDYFQHPRCGYWPLTLADAVAAPAVPSCPADEPAPAATRTAG
jgi:hypothetical protein